MKYLRFISWFALAGILVPQLFLAFWWLAHHYFKFIQPELAHALFDFQLLLHPSAFMALGTFGREGFPFDVHIISTLINVLVYIAVGSLVWLGLKKHWMFLVLLSGLLGGWWWFFFGWLGV